MAGLGSMGSMSSMGNMAGLLQGSAPGGMVHSLSHLSLGGGMGSMGMGMGGMGMGLPSGLVGGGGHKHGGLGSHDGTSSENLTVASHDSGGWGTSCEA